MYTYASMNFRRCTFGQRSADIEKSINNEQKKDNQARIWHAYNQFVFLFLETSFTSSSLSYHGKYTDVTINC